MNNLRNSNQISQLLSGKSSRRTALKGAAAAAAASGLTLGFAGGKSQTNAQDAANLTFWFDTTGGPETADCLVASVIEPYNALGGTQIEATLLANGWDATRTAVAGGAGPDIVVTPGPSFAFEMAQAGQLLPLDDFAASLGWDNLFLKWAVDLGRVDGTIYSIANEIETLVLYYNTTLFTEHGWTPATTMDELMTLSQTIADAGIIPFAHCNNEWRAANEWFAGEFLNQVAGSANVYAALTNTKKWTDPEFVDAITKLNTMQQNGWFMGGLDRYYTTVFADASAALAYGEAAMKIEGTWAFTDMVTFAAEAGSDWDWTPVPSTDGVASFDIGVGSTYSISKNTQSPDAAAEFLSYYLGVEAQAAAVAGCGMAPGPVTIPADQLAEIDPRQAGMIEAIGTSSSEGNYGYTTWTFFPPKTDVYIYEEIEKVWAGDITVDAYLTGLQTIFDEEFAAGDIPPIPVRG